MTNKVTTIGKLVLKKRNSAKTFVHCHGCYDCLHIGHVRHLLDAKAMGDILVVTVTADEFVNKGDGRPVYTADDRAEMLAALKCVDYVAINHAETALPILESLKPDVFVKGIDYAGTDTDEARFVRSYGGTVAFTYTEKYSTTELIERLKA